MSQPTAYQKVTNQFDVTEAGVQSLSYLAFDGVDDFMVTGTITPGVDKAQVFAGVRKLSDTARTVLLELSAISSNPGTFVVFAPSVALNNYAFGSGGTTSVSVIASGYSSPVTNVLTGIGDIAGDTTTLRINGAQVATSTTDQGTGNFLAYPLYLGRRGGTTLPLNGQIYSLITRFGANLDTTAITNTETWVNARTGAYT
jgi:hypothetical protein